MAPMTVLRTVERLLAPLRRRVLLMIGRGVLRLIDDAPMRQRLQVVALDGEVLDDVERMQQYGYTSHPPPGSDALVAALGGMRQHPVVLAAEHPSVRTYAHPPGTVALYTWQDGQRGGGVGRHRIMLAGGQPRILLTTRVDSGAGAYSRLGHGQILSVVESAPGLREARIQHTPTAITLRVGRSSIVIGDAGITVTTPAWDWRRAS